ncbi:MAG: glycosyl hydrolase family 65 protein [bacterium]
MELTENVLTDSGWEIYERALDPGQIVTTGSNYMIGNGYLGYRGTPAEWGADEYVACIVTDTWDRAPDSQMTELCNVPNALFVEPRLNGRALSLFDGPHHEYERRVDLRSGVFTRRTTWGSPTEPSVSVREEKLASYDDVRLLAMRYRLTAHRDATLTLRVGVDGHVWSLNGDHFRSTETFREDNVMGSESRTVELGTRIAVAQTCVRSGPEPTAEETEDDGRSVVRRFDYELSSGDEVVFAIVAAVYHSNDVEEPRSRAIRAAREAAGESHDANAVYEGLYECHRRHWDEMWRASDIGISGDLEVQTLARFNIYHNLIHTPAHARLPVGARGLSSQVYQGAAFWDQETFNLPMFVYTRPDLARSILEYRLDTLPGARRKARGLGYDGAFYAWTSGKTGDELFPDIFFTDVLTGRPIRNHFNCWQIHISPDVVYAVWQYYEATGDWNFLAESGAEIAFEVARFIVSRCLYRRDRDRYELIRLIGPDEYHENVDNNAYTMHLSRYALEIAVAIYEQLSTRDPERLAEIKARIGLDDGEVDVWREHVEKINLPQPDPESHLIEQFDGYFELEDITPDRLRERLIDPGEYWGWPNGIAVRTQVIKQADVLQLLTLIDGFSTDVLRANYEYYEPRTEHGSSLSPSVHAIVARRAGIAYEAERYFHEAATIDLYNKSRKVVSGGSFLGGVHTAACGGVWMAIVQGFAGFRVRDGAVQLEPAIPEGWGTVSFSVTYRGSVLRIRVAGTTVSVSSDEGNESAVTVRVRDRERAVAPGATSEFAD